jgi:CRP-like cAMP-binding protein
VDSNPLARFVAQLSSHTHLIDEERDALLGLPVRGHRATNKETIVRREEVIQNTCVVVSGLLARTSDTHYGSRQITSFYVRGEMPGLHTWMRPKATFALRAMSETEMVLVPQCALHKLASKYPAVSEAFSRELVRESDIMAQWVVNLGRRSAKERIAHLFCELAVKNGAAEGEQVNFAFPVTQTVLGDATGLSTVHVNRSLTSLRQDGALRFEHGEAFIPRFSALASVAGFDGAYLHDQPLRFTPEEFPMGECMSSAAFRP